MITIVFEDHGQDFLEWDVHPTTGEVQACRPFQEWLWVGVKVLNLRRLRTGTLVYFMRTDETAKVDIKYPISEVRRG